MAIDIGEAAIDRAGGASYNTTWINKGNPANDTGTIDSIEIYALNNLSGCKIGIFYTTNGNTLKCRSVVTLGAITAGSKQTFTTDSESNAISLTVVTGDYIGIYFASGDIESAYVGGDNLWYQTADHCVVDDSVAYSVHTGHLISLYGGGYTVAAPTVTTASATSVASFSATLNGEITDTGNENADERGFDYGLTASYGSAWTQEGDYGAATFSSVEFVTGLNPYATYHFRAKAHNSIGWGYGADDTFKTLIAKPYETHLSPTRLYKTTFVPEHLYEADLISEHLYKTTFEPIHLYKADLKVKPTDIYKAEMQAEHEYIATLGATRKLITTRYEYYNTGEDVEFGIGTTYWASQTFTPLLAHKITSVKLKLYREYSAGTITVGIRATDVDGKPTGADLCSGTTDGDTLTTDSSGEWREITLGDGYDLVADTKYAIVVRAPDAEKFGETVWWWSSSSAAYTRGWIELSDNSGSSWGETYTGYDMMFEEWSGSTVVVGATLEAEHKYWTTFKAEHKYTAKMEAK